MLAKLDWYTSHGVELHLEIARKESIAIGNG